MVENAGFMPKDASVAKRVWYGVGKAVESQSPKAWEQRILRVIDKQIIPKLSPENQKWAQEVRPKVEKFAKVAGVAIPVVEVVVVVGSTVVVGKKIKEGIRIHKNKVFEKKFKKRYGSNLGEPVVLPVAWATDPRSISRLDASLAHMAKNVAPNSFNTWIGDMTKEFSQKYGPISTHQMEQTLRQMGVAIGRNEKGIVPRWRSIIETAQKGSPAAVERAKRTLQKVFTDAYIQARGGVDRKANPQRAFIMDMMARDAFTKWENVQFPGLPELLNEGARYPESRVGVIQDIVPKFWQDATDFEVIDRSPPPFEQVLAAWKKGDPELLREMAEDPKWTRVVELLPNSPWGDIMDPQYRVMKDSIDISSLPTTFNRDTLGDIHPEPLVSSETPLPELGFLEGRKLKKLQKEELRLRWEKYHPRNMERKYKKETERLQAKQMDQTDTITYRDRLNQLANPPPDAEVLPVDSPVVELPVAPSQTPEQLLAQENAMWLSRIREIAKRRGQSPYGERFSQIIPVDGPQVPRTIPENPPFIDRMQRDRATAIASENTAMPVAGEDERAWWRERKANGLSTQTLTDTLRAEDQEIKSMLARDEAQRQAARAAEQARVDARRANRDPLETTLNYVFRGDRTPDRQQWFEQVLTRAQEMAATDRDMRDLLACATAIGGNTTFDRTEEAAVMARVLNRAFHTLPRSEQDWRGFKPNSDIFYTMASDLVGRFHRAEVPLALTQRVGAVNAGDILVNRLLETNDKKVRELVRKLAPVGTNRGEKMEVFEPTQELVDLFSYAYRQLTHTPNAQPLNSIDTGVVRRIAKQFVQRKDSPIARLYAKYPNPDWPKEWVDRMK